MTAVGIKGLKRQ